MTTDASEVFTTNTPRRWVVPEEELRKSMLESKVPPTEIQRWNCPCSKDCEAFILYGIGWGTIAGTDEKCRTLWVVCSLTADEDHLVIKGIDAADDDVDNLWGDWGDLEVLTHYQEDWSDTIHHFCRLGLYDVLQAELNRLKAN